MHFVIIDGADAEVHGHAADSLTRNLIEEYKQHLCFAIERWDMDYEIANAAIKPNYMQRRALKELNRIRATGAQKALVTAAAGAQGIMQTRPEGGLKKRRDPKVPSFLMQ